MPPYQVWIEAEEWVSSGWDPRDANSDVIVTVDDGTRWGASFFSYANVATLVAQWRASGESLHGTYFWSSNLILIDEVSRPQIERVIAHLMEEQLFERVFTRLEADDDPDVDDQLKSAVP